MEDRCQRRLRPEDLKKLMKTLDGERSATKQDRQGASSPQNIILSSSKKPENALNQRSAYKAALKSSSGGGSGMTAFNFSKALGPTSSSTLRTKQQTSTAPTLVENAREVSTSSASEAERWRERGNDLFKTGKYKKAAACYSSSIAVATSSAAYANRAMIHIKLKDYVACEADCTEALALDPSYVKAYLRRGTARREQGNLEFAIEDFETALRYEPTNKAAAENRRACIAAWVSSKQHKGEANMQPVVEYVPVTFSEVESESGGGGGSSGFLLNQVSTKKLEHVAPVVVQPKRALVHEIEELEDESDVLPPLPFASLMAEEPVQQNHVVAEEAMAMHAREKEVSGVLLETKPLEVLPAPEPASAALPGAPKTPIKLKAPRNGIEFEREWKRFKSDLELQAAYLCLLTPAQLPPLLKQALTPPLLVSIQHALLGPALRGCPEKAVGLLEALPLTPRFSMNVLSLSAAQKTQLAAAWDAALSSLEGCGSKHDALIKNLQALRPQF